MLNIIGISLKYKELAILIVSEPAINETGYVSKYLPLIEKHIDRDVFKVHIIASYSGLKPLKKKFSNVYPIMFYPTASYGIRLYLGYLLYLLLAFFKVIRLAPRIGAQVLVSLGGHAYSGLIVALAAKLLHRKSVVRVSEPTRYIVWLKYKLGPLISCFICFLERLTFYLCDVVISNRDMRSYSPRLVRKQLLLSQGVDLSIFNPKVTPAISSKCFPKLITVARLDKIKNIEGVIEAVKLLKGKYPEISYHIVGSGPEEANLRNKVRELNLEKEVYFHGQVSPEMVPKLLKSCDVFVLPSFIEGLPSAVLEAMACGLPVIIGSTTAGRKEWFVDGENALIVKSVPQSIAEAVNQLLSNKELRNKLIANGIKYVREYHDSSRTKVQFTNIILELLKQR